MSSKEIKCNFLSKLLLLPLTEMRFGRPGRTNIDGGIFVFPTSNGKIGSWRLLPVNTVLSLTSDIMKHLHTVLCVIQVRMQHH